MSFKAQISKDSKNIFLNSDEFAEEITYTPLVGSAKTIKAIVVQQGLEPGSENISRSLRNRAEVYIANDAIEGVTLIDKRDDKITLNDIEGTSREARINEILHKDEGIWHLLVGW